MNGHGPSILQCPSCGASLRIEEYETSIICQYCGNRVLVPEEYLPQKPPPAPPPVRSTPVAEIEEPEPSVKIEAVPSAMPLRVSIVVMLLGVIILGVLGLIFALTAGGGNILSGAISDQGTTLETTPVGEIQRPVAPIPTFTPLAELLLKFGSEGDGEGQFNDPRYVAIDPTGNIFIGDYSGGHINKFDPQGNFQMLIQVSPPDTNSNLYMRGIAVDSQSRLYVAMDGDILIYDGADGIMLDLIPSGWPYIYYDSVYIADDFLYSTNGMAGTDDLLKLSTDGEILLHRQEVIESVDRDDPAMDMQLAIDAHGQMYVLSNFGPHIYVYDPQGEYLYRFGEEGNGRGMIDLSSDLIAVDPRGRLYVASGYRIDQFDAQGNYLDYSIDTYGDTDNGVPMGMAFDAQGYLYLVCNNGRVLKYQINSR